MWEAGFLKTREVDCSHEDERGALQKKRSRTGGVARPTNLGKNPRYKTVRAHREISRKGKEVHWKKR